MTREAAHAYTLNVPPAVFERVHDYAVRHGLRTAEALDVLTLYAAAVVAPPPSRTAAVDLRTYIERTDPEAVELLARHAWHYRQAATLREAGGDELLIGRHENEAERLIAERDELVARRMHEAAE